MGKFFMVVGFLGITGGILAANFGGGVIAAALIGGGVSSFALGLLVDHFTDRIDKMIDVLEEIRDGKKRYYGEEWAETPAPPQEQDK